MKGTPIFLIFAAAALTFPGASGQVRTAPKAAGQATLNAEGVKAFDELGVELAKLIDAQRQLSATAVKLEDLCAKLAKAGENVDKAVEPAEKALVYIRAQAGGNEIAALVKAARDFQEMSQSFNLQYLGLQQQMQDENRRFTLISNIMKTKHDTAKNSISNVR
jgi:uncharacterized tellurite resistance protein B-like protein